MRRQLQKLHMKNVKDVVDRMAVALGIHQNQLKNSKLDLPEFLQEKDLPKVIPANTKFCYNSDNCAYKYRCPMYCEWVGEFDDMIAHCKEAHSTFFFENAANICYAQTDDIKSCIYGVSLIYAYKKLFRCILEKNPDTDSFRWCTTVIERKDQPSLKNYTFYLQLKLKLDSFSKDNDKFEAEVTKESETMFEDPKKMIEMPRDVMQKYSKDSGIGHYRVFVVENDKDTQKFKENYNKMCGPTENFYRHSRLLNEWSFQGLCRCYDGLAEQIKVLPEECDNLCVNMSCKL